MVNTLAGPVPPLWRVRQIMAAIATDQKAATTDAPPFASIGRRPDFDPAKIEFFLRDPHPKMPNMTLSRAESADIAAYIATLK